LPEKPSIGKCEGAKFIAFNRKRRNFLCQELCGEPRDDETGRRGLEMYGSMLALFSGLDDLL
jgi:hypothetical protein